MKFLFLLIFSITSSCISQNNIEIQARSDLNFESITKSFDAKDINYIGTERYCNSGNDSKLFETDKCKNCYSYKDIYIFWSDNSKSYIQKFDTCSEYNMIEIFGFDVDYYLKTNLEELQNQKVDRYELADKSYVVVSHTCYGNYIINYNNLKFGVEFDYFNLSGENKNLNYKKNNALKVIILDKKLETIINDLENENQFKRDKSTCRNRS